MQRARWGADILTIGFGTTVAVWSLLYVAALPPGAPAMWIGVAIAIAACLLLGGWRLGRRAGRGPAGGAAMGALVTGVSLLVLLSLMGDDRAALGPALGWTGGLLLAAAGLGALGAAIGAHAAGDGIPAVSWTPRLARVTAITTLLMLLAGGIVTGLEAGLAVEGWLNAEGHFLALFPIGLMRRDVPTFVEHAHRLWGLLVGLTTIVLMIHLWLADRRAGVRWLGTAVLAAVIAQGVLGGTRVTEQSVALGIVHGVFAQVVLAAIVSIWVVTSDAWRADTPPTVSPSVGTDRGLTTALVIVVLLQVALGTLFRHMQPEPDVPRGLLMGLLHGHSFVGSLLVVLLVLFCGVRAWGVYAEQRPVRQSGILLIFAMILQVLLGIGAFIVVPKGPRDPGAAIGRAEVLITTLHQSTGAVLLSAAVALWLWERRCLRR